MRLLGRIGAALTVLLALVVLAAWIVPPMLDWNRYRDEIATLAAEQLGRAVRIEGPVSLALLPQPVLTAARVSVEQRDPATGRTLAVAEMRLRIALGALLSGRIDVRELVLRGLDLRLPWPLETSVSALRAPTWLQGVSARIEDGRVSIGDLAFTGIDCTLTTGGLTGSYEAAGTATLSGRVWRFTARATQPGGDGSIGLDGTLDGQGGARDTGLVVSGQLGGDGTFGGRVTARGPDLSQLLPAPHVAFRADGRVTVAGGLAEADELDVEIGGSPARGAVALRISPVPRLDVALAAGRLDLDTWLPTLLHGGSPIVAIGIDLSAEAADLAGGTLRHLRGAFDLAGDAVEVRELRAQLPGDADLRLAGTITRPDAARPRFDGQARIAAPALRTTLAWVERAGFGAFSTLPTEVLRSADLGGRASIEAGVVSLSEMAGRIDASAVTGTVAARVGGRLAVSATLHLDRFDADPWLPEAAPPPAAMGERVRGFDFDLRLDARRASARGLAIAPLAIDVLANGGGLTLRRLELATADIGVSASGTVLDGGRIADGRLDMQARQMEPLAALLPEGAASWLRGTPALLRAPAKLQAALSGPPEALSVRLVADLGDLRIEAQPTLNLARAQWSAPVTMRHPGAPRLAEALGLAGATAWLGDGSLAVVATVSGAPGRIAADSFDVTAGGLHASGQASLDTQGAKPMLAGRIKAESLPLPLPYLRSPAPLPVAALAGWNAAVAIQAAQVSLGSVVLEQATTSLTLRDGMLRLDGLTGRIGGGRLAGEIALASAAQPPALNVVARIEAASVSGGLFETSLDLASGTLDADAALSAEGYSPAALLATLRGSVTLAVRDGQLAGFDLTRLATLSDADIGAGLAAGRTAFTKLALHGRVQRGSIALDDMTIDAPSGQARVAGTVDLPNAAADLLIAARPVLADGREEPPEIGERLTGPLDSLRRTPQLADLAGWRARHVDAARAAP